LDRTANLIDPEPDRQFHRDGDGHEHRDGDRYEYGHEHGHDERVGVSDQLHRLH